MRKTHTHGIKFRVMGRLAVITVVILVSFAMILYHFFLEVINNNLSRRGGYDAQRNLLQIQGAVESVYQLGEFLALSKETGDFLDRADSFAPLERTTEATRLMNTLNVSLPIRKYIHSFCVVTNSGETYWSQCPYDDFFRDWLAEQVDVTLPTDRLGFTESYAFPSRSVYYVNENLVSCISNIFEVGNNQLIKRGQIIVNLNLGLLMEELLDADSLFDQICVVNEAGTVLYFSGGDLDGFAGLPLQQLGEGLEKVNRGYFFINHLSNADWRIISSVDPRQLQQSTGFPLAGVAAIVLCALCLLFALVFPMLIRISNQIVSLDQSIAKVAQGDLSVRTELKGTRELEAISRGFNIMVVNTDRYMKESIASLRERQKLRFELLLAKINPHFIYNTLNSIIYLARSGKTSAIVELTSAFIYLLQDSIHLEKDSQMELVEVELAVIEKYITIQNCRYAERFAFISQADPALHGTYILKNMLQPLIENAILHGICPQPGSGTICMELKRAGDDIRIRIADDGIGMEQTKADLLLAGAWEEESADAPKIRHIGLGNIIQRLEIAFPGNHTVSMTSSPRQGTEIIIRHPVVVTPESSADHI